MKQVPTNSLHPVEALIIHRPHDPTETVKLVSREDVEQYLKDSSGTIAYGDKKTRIQQATNLKSIIYWLMTAIDGKD